jgi:hypothetical protein
VKLLHRALLGSLVLNINLNFPERSKSVADLKARFPVLQDSMKHQLGNEMDRMVVEERFLKEEPEHLETSLKRCKKLTGTLVTLKRYDLTPDSTTVTESCQKTDTDTIKIKIVMLITTDSFAFRNSSPM